MPLDIRPQERGHRETTSADCEQKATAAVPTKHSSHQDISASMEADAVVKPKTAANTQSHKPSQQTPSSSHASVRSKSRELYLHGGETVTADNRLDSEQQRKPFLTTEAPVREEKQTNCSLTSSESDRSFQVQRLSYSGRKVESVKPFPVSVSSAADFTEFGSLTPDTSDLTVYNEIAKVTPPTQTLTFPKVKMSGNREPTPGSEGERQHGFSSRPLFAELRQCQQDSGFDSPLYQQK